MNEATTEAPRASTTAAANLVDDFARKAVHKLLAGLEIGQLSVTEKGFPDQLYGNTGGLTATLAVNDSGLYKKLLTGGENAFAEGYVDGLWDSNDLVSLIRIAMANLDLLDKFGEGFAPVRRVAERIGVMLKRNSLSGSKRNIAAHYDLGNDFYSLFLDESLTYSSAIFADEKMSLADAQTNKLDVICKKLRLKPGDRVLEIGCGWGGFALHAAKNFGAEVVGITLSKEQLKEGKERVASAKMEHLIDLRFVDYRDLTPDNEGLFDKVVSIEMIEAVGHEFFPVYLGQIEKMLKPDGEALIQAITTSDWNYEDMRGKTDFIREQIFPGGHLPSIAELLRVSTKHNRLRLVHLEDYAGDYAKTLHCWHQAYEKTLPQVRDQGFSEVFIRMWRLYLTACEALFADRTTGLAHLIFTRPGCIRPPVGATA